MQFLFTAPLAEWRLKRMYWQKLILLWNFRQELHVFIFLGGATDAIFIVSLLNKTRCSCLSLALLSENLRECISKRLYSFGAFVSLYMFSFILESWLIGFFFLPSLYLIRHAALIYWKLKRMYWQKIILLWSFRQKLYVFILLEGLLMWGIFFRRLFT